jgi:hypothetical protein
MKLYLLIGVFVFWFSTSCFAQEPTLGSWNIANIKYNYDKKWSFFGEAQLRSLAFYSNFHYYEYKAGVNFSVLDNVVLTLGAGSYQTYSESGNFILPKNNDEFRIWPQVVLLQTIGKVKIEQRFRTELRFTSSGYRTRFRYRFGLNYAFGTTSKEYKPFLIGLSNELFFTNKEPYFERNRFLTFFNYKPSKMATLQLGYLHQFDYKINDEIGSDFLVLGYYVELFSKHYNSKSIDSNGLVD